jgi:hypothetical protein
MADYDPEFDADRHRYDNADRNSDTDADRNTSGCLSGWISDLQDHECRAQYGLVGR